jgi:polysaccharide biosynthesis transport protein
VVMHAVLAACRCRWLLILSIAALGTALAAAAGSRVQPKFTATAAVMISPRASPIVGRDPLLSEASADLAAVESQISLIKSRDRAERVARALELHKDPELGRGERHERVLAFTIADPWRTLVQWLPGDWLIATGLAEEQVSSGEDDPRAGIDHAIDALASRLKVARVGGSHVINISFTAADPSTAAAVANKTAQLVVEDRLALEPAAPAKSSAGAPAKIEASGVGRERSKGGGDRARADSDLAADRLGLNEQELAGLQRELIVAEAELAGRRARLDLISSLRARGDGLHALPEVMASPHVADLWRQETELHQVEAELRSLYGDNHPQLRSVLAEKASLAAKLEAAIGRIVANLEHETRMIEGRIAALVTRLDLAESANVERDQAEVRSPGLAHRAVADRPAHQGEAQTYGQTPEPAQIREPAARIIARATPPMAPSSPGLPVFAAFGFVSSSLVGVLVALLADRLDRRVRDPAQLQARLGLRWLATCPRLPRAYTRRGKAAHDYVLERPRSHYTESMRSLQLALRGALDAGVPRVIQITSAVPDEGKTALALSLAAVLAQTGARVLLFELDLRRPSILKRSWSHADGTAASTPLFSELRHDPHAGIDLILVSNPPRRPEAVLTSPDLADVMRRLRRRYDHIVVDSAALLDASDAKVPGQLVDAIILAVRWQSTSVELVRAARDQLRRGAAPLLGAVLTQVAFDRQARLGTDTGYRRKCRGYYID